MDLEHAVDHGALELKVIVRKEEAGQGATATNFDLSARASQTKDNGPPHVVNPMSRVSNRRTPKRSRSAKPAGTRGVEASKTKEGGHNASRGSGHDRKDDTRSQGRNKCCGYKAQCVMLVVLLFNTLVLAFYLAMHTTNMLDDLVNEPKTRSWINITPTTTVLAGILCSVGLGITFWVCVQVKDYTIIIVVR